MLLKVYFLLSIGIRSVEKLAFSLCMVNHRKVSFFQLYLAAQCYLSRSEHRSAVLPRITINSLCFEMSDSRVKNFTPKLLPGKLYKLELNKKHPLTFMIGQE